MNDTKSLVNKYLTKKMDRTLFRATSKCPLLAERGLTKNYNMKKLSIKEYRTHITDKNAVVLFDAEWDIGPGGAVRSKIKSVEETFKDSIFFGEVDVDKEQELASSVPILNVPSIAYYKEGVLQKVELGETQDIKQNIRTLCL